MNGVILGQLSGNEPAVTRKWWILIVEKKRNSQTELYLHTVDLFWVFFKPENRLAADVLGLQGHPRQELVAKAIVKGAVQVRGAVVCIQNPEALHFVFTVHQQLGFIAINADQDHILHDPAHIAAQEFVSYAVCEKLQ